MWTPFWWSSGRWRAEGFALDREEFMEGMIALAVPIAGPDGRLVATLSFHAPTPRFEAARALGFLPALRRSARDLAQLIDEPPAA